ncbi:5675_t:CDS:1, partial [Acaulospora colombiana]
RVATGTSKKQLTSQRYVLSFAFFNVVLTTQLDTKTLCIEI